MLVLLALLGCEGIGGDLADDTAAGPTGDGICLWICDEAFPYWESDLAPSLDQEQCADYAVHRCGGDPWSTLWMDESPGTCCIQACPGSVNSSPNAATQEECEEQLPADEDCWGPTLVQYTCDAY